MKRSAELKRKTNETDVFVSVNLDGVGKYSINTGIGFFDHMLETFSKQSLIDLKVNVNGDLKVDEHHTVEDVGIVIGEVINKALGKRIGVKRYGFVVPMDESLAEVAIDLGGRRCVVFNCQYSREMIGDMPTELIEDFFIALAENLKASIHINVKYGRNDHHKAEAIFKAFGRALRMACEDDSRINDIPSTKGII